MREYRPGSSRQIDAMQARYARNGLARPYPASAMIIDHYQPGPATPGLQP
ncbi:MAG: hypothetical protein KBD25_03480 [Rickettsiaceae bacterium]|nr:hypothetical protein [Rickettsiaceae bacterium]